MNKFKTKRGFTLVEMLVTLSIIVLMSSLLIIYTRSGEKIGQLNRGVERLSFDVRRMASMSMQTKQVKDKSTGEMRDVCGWGIYFPDNKKNEYIIFSDYCLGDKKNDDLQDIGNFIYDEEEMQEIVKLGRNVIIYADTFKNFLYIPPEPKLRILDRNNSLIDMGELQLSVGPQNTKTIQLTASGNFLIK
jgi:prepilin-type N-terminal cleavage/methylation domain-containing protein